MKGNLLLWAFICVVIFACGKAEMENTPPSTPERKIPETSILGTWELRELQGGFRPANAQVYYPAGNGNTWEFTDSTFKQTYEGVLANEGTYTFTKDTALATGRLMDAFVMSTNNYLHQIYFEFKQDTLLLYDGQIAADGTIGKYVRSDSR
ncbi:MAG TPA: hypothetical protein VLC28_07845 [Flavitalea sp.]|nr:hypothetical protein [Flavitalea sp.]